MRKAGIICLQRRRRVVTTKGQVHLPVGKSVVCKICDPPP